MSKPLYIVGMGKRSTAEPYGWRRMNCDSCCNQWGGQSTKKGILASCCACVHQLHVAATYLQQSMSTGRGRSVGRICTTPLLLNNVQVFLSKPYGEGQMTTEAGGRYCLKPLAMNHHVGDLGVMVALMSTWSDDSSCILPEWQSSPPWDSTAFPWRGGEEKRIPKESSFYLNQLLVTAASWLSNLTVDQELLHVETTKTKQM